MADLAFVLTIIAFFILSAMFVRFCDSVIGADEEAFADGPEYAQESGTEERAAA